MKWFFRPHRRKVLDCASPRRCCGFGRWRIVSIASVLFAVIALFPSESCGAQLVTNWTGIAVGTGTAADPHGAAGPNGILEVSNFGITYRTRAGAQIWTTNETGFFLPTVCCDAKALYDPVSQRFFLIAQARNTTAGSASNLFVNVSRNSNPQSAGTNDWFKYKLFLGFNIDYPGIGLDAQALYASYGAGFQQWIIVRKADLLTNAASPYVITANTPANAPGFFNQGLQAVSVIGSSSPGDVAYCVTMTASNVITLSAVTNPIGPAPALFSTNIPAPSVGNPNLYPNAPQLGTANRLNSGGMVTMGNAFWRDGELWFCGGAGSTNQPERTLVRWYKLKTGGFPNGQASLAEWGELDGGTNTWRQHSAIGGNARGDVCLVFTQTSSNTVNTMRSAIRKAGETAFTEVLVRSSTGFFTVRNQDTNAPGVARWADYCVVTPDPEDQTFWVSHLTLTATDNASIWWGNVARDNLFFVNKNAVGSELGTRELPFHSVRAAHTAASGAKTFVIKPANYPEPTLPLRLDKNVRLENPYPSGTVHIGP